MTGPIERVLPGDIRVGDTIGSSDGTDWLVVARMRSDVVQREVGSRREILLVFTFEDGEEGERVWTYLETDLVPRQTKMG